MLNSKWKEDYTKIDSVASVEDKWASLKAVLSKLRDTYVPKQKSNDRPRWKERGSFPRSSETRDALKEKNKAFRSWMTAKSILHRDAARPNYTKLRNKVKTLLRKSKRLFEKGIAQRSKSNPKAFWSHTRRKLKTKCNVAPLLEDVKNKSSLRFKDKEKANILQKRFSSVFTKEPEGATPIINKRTNSVLQDISITVDMVRLHLLKLNVNKSCDPDEIYPRMLLELADIIAGPVAFLLNKILASGTMPKDWKLAFVTPIYKKGSKNVAENYRPISLTSVLCKIMESLIREHVLKHLLKNRLLSNKQYGFINGRSTTTQLLYYSDQCVAKIAEGGVIDPIYLDFAKAFDTVPHHRLLGKLQAYGIQGNLFHWIKEFLKERTQIVMVNGVESEPTSVLSGIPQGTVLGPLLFVVYINDILEDVESHGLLFADDTKIYRVITK